MIGFILGVTEEEVSEIFGAMVWGILWFGATPVAWRETAKNASHVFDHWVRTRSRVTYGSYNMTGLRETRCPECGSQFTIDQLMVAGRER